MRRTVVLGLVAVVFGFTVVVQRGLADAFGSMSYTFVMLVGAFALVQGLRYASDARDADARATDTADVEDRHEVPSPGSDVDELLAGTGGLTTVSIRGRREFHERIRRVARETLLVRGDYDETTVSEALDAGTWTADPVAAWFLGTNLAPPPAVRIRGFLGSDVEFRFGAERTVAALAAVRAGDVEPDGHTSAEASGLLSAVRSLGRRRLGTLRDRFGGVGR
ncbi:hypothetical protein HUG10_16560 [Halorarum halophilum]|uniref:Uncharacterized protein n=1 Tax=Halorarum halophilum TaxID=2743090 RepID=A0A7D5GJP7_9EURY|nr:hypothetical protein [Halobaculum halophilum]QLG29051.1 hypothetical protein HUG10_16560 [Halobaculum halophilum]